METDIFHPKLIEVFNGKTIEMTACGDYHTCAVTHSGDLYTLGDGSSGCGLLGHGTDVSHWIPKRVNGPTDGFQITFVSCGPWHTALLTSTDPLFTFGDGTFGALGHGDRSGTSIPREVEALKGLHAQHVACGVWHTAAVVKLVYKSSTSGQGLYSSSAGKLYTWGDGEYGQLGHGDDKPRLVPERVSSLVDTDFSQVACGNKLTVALTTSGNVYTMGKDGKGSNLYKRVFSQSPSPVLGKRSSTPSPSPSFSFRTLEATPDELRSSNDILSMELKSLRQQVDKLSTKSQSLESELERKSEQLKEVAALHGQPLKLKKARLRKK
ncbi:PH, RCC1 and FYVE domains-containing protein 1-like [Salvia splendens]|uniref:PH, RCC1 and FYVE domains-containing protein 1-like n=1 Tax=Salvia splendens TaxID=180675 RepID=UPI001C27A39A|nr:PH, RCC1 and FYVE domains-containing protein 1-like [Salvia splendens]